VAREYSTFIYGSLIVLGLPDKAIVLRATVHTRISHFSLVSTFFPDRSTQGSSVTLDLPDMAESVFLSQLDDVLMATTLVLGILLGASHLTSEL
jgi:hypothetical protein